MGRTKKFIDKKKSATFQLIARDSSDPYYDDTPGNDRVFVRVDNNPVSLESFSEDPHGQYDDDSRFDDAPGDDEADEDFSGGVGSSSRASNIGAGRLPDQVRKEILELGFPDDGYNYLHHLREIKNSSGGSAFFHNPKFKAEEVPRDVKAYDASRVHVSEAKDDQVEKAIYTVASKTVSVRRLEKAVDPEVAALLDDIDVSRFGSDLEDLEEDFVVVANMAEEGDEVFIDEEGDGVVTNKKMNLVGDSEVMIDDFEGTSDAIYRKVDSGKKKVTDEVRVQQEDEKQRVRRPLDEQFDMLELQEYGSDDDGYYDGYEAESKALVQESKNVFNDLPMDDLELGDKYVGPADLLKANEGPINKDLLDRAAVILRRCAEYGEKYENESEDDKAVIFEESSDESEQWDCESIISTYSNLDNHPAKIGAPTNARKKKLSEAVSGALKATGPVITLRGKEKLPIDFLPYNNKKIAEKVKTDGGMKTEQLKRTVGQETKEEKKERKAAIKEERREARKVKKEMKGLYRCEAQRAQKAAAITGPASIHLM